MFILKSVRYWLTLVVLSVVVVAFLVVWIYVSPTLEERLVNQKLETLRRNMSLVQAAIAVDATGDLDSKEAREILRYQSVVIDGRIDARVVIFDSTARSVLADSRPGLKLSARDYPQARETTMSGTTELGIVTVDDIAYATAASVVSLAPLSAGGPPHDSAVVLVIASLDDVEASVGVVRERLALATALALAVATVVGFIVAWAISGRVRKIEEEARIIADGDFSASVSVHVHDEIGQLAEGFNRMRDRLSSAFSHMSRQRKRVEVLLDTLNEGVITVDATGRTTIENSAASRLLGTDRNHGSLVEHHLPEQVVELWRQCVADRQSHSAVLDYRGQTLEAMVYPVYPVDAETNTHSAITLRDVSAEARLDKSRKDFLANASHELKTPLFSLAGFLDILVENRVDDAERQRFLHLMRSQVSRMRRLATDLLDLSRLDAGTVELHPSLENPAAVIQGAMSEFEGSAQAKAITLEMRAGSAPEHVFVDAGKLEEVVRVLVDNAVKYSHSGNRVAVEVHHDEHSLIVRVSDDGPAIPADELECIFERFYRTERSRSRERGSGLGLPIARELARLMGGTLTARDTGGEGAVFVLTLPLTRT